jgi:hypothetical protein
MLKPLEKLHLQLCIAAALVVAIACIISGSTPFWMAAWVSLTIVLFYVIGECLRFFLTTQVFPAEEEADEPEALLDEEEMLPVFDDAEETEEALEPIENAFLD